MIAWELLKRWDAGERVWSWAMGGNDSTYNAWALRYCAGFGRTPGTSLRSTGLWHSPRLFHVAAPSHGCPFFGVVESPFFNLIGRAA